MLRAYEFLLQSRAVGIDQGNSPAPAEPVFRWRTADQAECHLPLRDRRLQNLRSSHRQGAY